jgi:8-oxo-dGTP diphosphatase
MKELERIGDTTTCSSAFIIRDKKILLGLRHYTPDKWKAISVWTTPGGRCEAGETLGHNLMRETEEETGITELVIKSYLGNYEGGKEGDTVYVFLCETNQEPRLAEPDKFSEWRWFPFDQLPENMIRPQIATILAGL